MSGVLGAASQQLMVPCGNRRDGFTMIELVVTMIIVGILAFTVLPRFDALGGFDAAGYSDQTRSLLRYAQKTAVAQRRWVAVDVGANPPTMCSQTYPSLTYPTCAAACSGGTDVPLPGGTMRTPRASTTLAGATVLCFDAVGRPFASGVSTPLVAAANVNISDDGVLYRTISVEAETGYVR